MEDIIADAKALGKKIAAHPRMKEFLTAARAVAEDTEAQEILKKYQDHAGKTRELEATGKPIESEQKKALAEAEAMVAGNNLLKDMMRCQADYLEMMQKINAAIDETAAQQ